MRPPSKSREQQQTSLLNTMHAPYGGPPPRLGPQLNHHAQPCACGWRVLDPHVGKNACRYQNNSSANTSVWSSPHATSNTRSLSSAKKYTSHGSDTLRRPAPRTHNQGTTSGTHSTHQPPKPRRNRPSWGRVKASRSQRRHSSSLARPATASRDCRDHSPCGQHLVDHAGAAALHGEQEQVANSGQQALTLLSPSPPPAP